MNRKTPTRARYDSILWKRLDIAGHEVAELEQTASGWRLGGIAVLADAERPCWLKYDIRCASEWITEAVVVEGRIGNSAVDIELLRNPAGEWSRNGSKVWDLTGCDDVDLNFSPSTNLLPIRRLSLEVGQGAPVRAAWLRFPSLELQVLEQVYTRLSAETYRYESANGRFRRDIIVDSEGFVTDYPDFWRAEARWRG